MRNKIFYKKIIAGIKCCVLRGYIWYKYKMNDVIVVIGDSHVNFFSGNEELTYLPIGKGINYCKNINQDHNFLVFHLGPTLAYNAIKENSSTRFFEKSMYLAKHLKSGQQIVCCLGEIDIRVHVLKETENQGVSSEEIIDSVIENYVKYLCVMKAMGFEMYVWAPIASQPDTIERSETFPRYGSMQDRNRATLYFSKALKQKCDQLGIGFMSLAEDLIERVGETVRKIKWCKIFSHW